MNGLKKKMVTGEVIGMIKNAIKSRCKEYGVDIDNAHLILAVTDKTKHSISPIAFFVSETEMKSYPVPINKICSPTKKTLYKAMGFDVDTETHKWIINFCKMAAKDADKDVFKCAYMLKVNNKMPNGIRATMHYERAYVKDIDLNYILKTKDDEQDS
jgi:hypothetical protein